jgi:DNA-directed RNA polymerase specialized sigma24 family protein
LIAWLQQTLRRAAPDAIDRETARQRDPAPDQLPEGQRDAVVLRDLIGTAVGEIAERLGRTEQSVAGLLQRARRRRRGQPAEAG